MSVEAKLRALDTAVRPASDRAAASQMLAQTIRRRLQEANDESSRQWRTLTTRQEWEAFRADRLAALRKSLGTLPTNSRAPRTYKSGQLEGDGFVVEKLIFDSRPGLWVTANLYRPAKIDDRHPGMIICHSHHNPKTQDELQTMGMTWARLGCYVLVMDQLGHGERRQHPFRSAADYPQEFRVGRQDYFYRYDTSLQLLLIGDSLMGWMVGDLVRGIDVLFAQEGIDPKRIILLGAVAGGGDPAAVTAALDERIAAVAPFNFGGPQPENRYPLPDDAERSFPYAGSGSWESTRNLRASATAGFLPWVIVGSIAPRALIYGHEFSWDRSRDPVWKRLETVFGWYHAEDRLAFAHGAGVLSGQPPEATHCNNIGRAHRKMIYPALARWFQIAGSPEDEYSRTFRPEELMCWTPELAAQLKPKLVHQLAAEISEHHQIRIAGELGRLSQTARRDLLRKRWAEMLGEVEPNKQPIVRLKRDEQELGGITIERVALGIEPGMEIPFLLLRPSVRGPAPLVMGVCQQGKGRFLRERAEAIAHMLTAGVAVCLIDVRGTGETAPADDSRDRTSAATSLSASEWMLGGTLLGARLRDLRTVLGYLHSRESIAGDRIVLWGESFAAVNDSDQPTVAPQGIDKRPAVAEPLCGLLALLAALYEDDVRAVYVRRGLLSYSTALDSPAVHLPHDAIVPGAIAAGDLTSLVAALPDVAVHFEEPVDASNRRVSEAAIAAVRENVRRAGGALRLTASTQSATNKSLGQWIVERLQRN